jgi:YHS domain-containing protein
MISVKDPVCGKEFDLCDAQAHEYHRGWAYFFCSDRCHQTFAAHRDCFTGIEQMARVTPSPPPKDREAPMDEIWMPWFVLRSLKLPSGTI